MTPDAAREFTDALGQIHQGGWRLVLHAMREGVPAALGLTTREWVGQLGGYVRLPLEERREAARELVGPEGLTQRDAADVLGVGLGTVNSDVQNRTPDLADQPESARDVQNGTPDPERLAELAEAEAEAEARRREAVARHNVDQALVLLDPLRLDPEHRAEQWAGYLAGYVDVAALRRALAVLEALIARLEEEHAPPPPSR